MYVDKNDNEPFLNMFMWGWHFLLYSPHPKSAIQVKCEQQLEHYVQYIIYKKLQVTVYFHSS